jgi:hypothetical protein
MLYSHGKHSVLQQRSISPLATHQAIAVTGQAILGLLADACPKPEFAGAEFELYQPSNFQKPMSEGLSLFLYRVTVNLGQRNQSSRPRADGQRPRRPLPLDLHYMLTPWAATAARQQRMLGWAMRSLEDTPILDSGYLNHYGPEAGIFLDSETVELSHDPISLQDMLNIWDVFKPNQQLSVTYLARMVSIESELGIAEFAPVQTRVFEIGHAAGRT